MTKLLVKELKGYTFRLFDIDSKKTYRAHRSDFQLCVGSLLTVTNLEVSGDYVEKMTVSEEIVGDSSKKRIEVEIDKVNLGDLIDGVPVLNFGRVYASKGKKMAYAYFK